MPPPTLKYYGIEFPVRLIRGDMLNTGLPDNEYDIALLCQSLHHAEAPITLLKEVRRVCRKEADIFVIGEHYFRFSRYWMQVAKHLVKYVINYRGYRENRYLIPSYDDLFPPCLVKGDFHYSPQQYIHMFKRAGLHVRAHVTNPQAGIQAYCLSIEQAR